MQTFTTVVIQHKQRCNHQAIDAIDAIAPVFTMANDFNPITETLVGDIM